MIALSKRTPQNLDVIVHIGQSNQVGTSTNGTTLTQGQIPYDRDILYWEQSGGWDMVGVDWSGLDNDTGGWATLESWGGFGPSISLLRYVRANDDRYRNQEARLAGFKFAANGTAMTAQWQTGSRPTGESLVEQALTRWATAKAELEADGYTVRIIAFDWTGNEGDSNYFDPHGTLTQATYEAAIVSFAAELRAWPGASEDTVLLWNRIHDGDPAVFDPGDTALAFGWPRNRESQVNAITSLSDAYIIDSDAASRPADNIHYNSAGKEYIGLEKAKAYLGESYAAATNP